MKKALLILSILFISMSWTRSKTSSSNKCNGEGKVKLFGSGHYNGCGLKPKEITQKM
jgi:hypothetical protein